MTTSEFVSDVVVRSEGKIPTFTTGSTKWLRIVAIGNYFLRSFARERGVDWDRYYNPGLSFGTVTATDTFNIPSTVRKLSQQEGDVLRITHTDGQISEYTRVAHNRLKEHSSSNAYAKIGSTIKFSSAFTADSPQFGGTITCPVYTFPDTFSADADELDLDNPDWLVCVTAADRVKNDVTRKDLRADLIAEANEIMTSLKEEQLAQYEDAQHEWSPTGHLENEW